jgi:hypothetical protein
MKIVDNRRPERAKLDGAKLDTRVTTSYRMQTEAEDDRDRSTVSVNPLPQKTFARDERALYKVQFTVEIAFRQPPKRLMRRTTVKGTFYRKATMYGRKRWKQWWQR